MKHILLLSHDPVFQSQGLAILDEIYGVHKPLKIKQIDILEDRIWQFTGLEDVTVEVVMETRVFSYPSKIFDPVSTEKKILKQASNLCIEWNDLIKTDEETVLRAIENNQVLVQQWNYTIGIEHVHRLADVIEKYIRNHRHNKKPAVSSRLRS